MPPVTAVAPRTVASPASRRVGLANVVRLAKRQPMRVLLHGVEKIGKTSFAADAPAPIFICPEEGLPPALAATAHFDAPEGGWRWNDILDAVRSLANEPHEFQTLVLDTLDWIEPLIWADLCTRNKWAGIEDAGYGKGYVAAVEEWRRLIAELEQLRRSRGMHIIVLAHSAIRAFKDPESEGWDRYELKAHKAAAGLWKEWVDCVMFAKHDQVATKDQRTKRVRGISTGARLLHTVHNAAFDAGNRYSLPETLPLDWQAFSDAVTGGSPAEAEQLRAAIEEQLRSVEPTLASKVRVSLERAGDNGAELARIHNKLTAVATGDAQKGA